MFARARAYPRPKAGANMCIRRWYVSTSSVSIQFCKTSRQNWEFCELAGHGCRQKCTVTEILWDQARSGSDNMLSDTMTEVLKQRLEVINCPIPAPPHSDL